MDELPQITVQATDISAFAASHDMPPTGDPDEFWFTEAGVNLAIVAFKQAVTPGVWTGTVYAHPERSASEITDIIKGRLSRTKVPT
jgi:hypothetical protein